MKEVKIIDAIMGSGKTHDAIEKMKCHKGKFIYVTPFLDEVERIKKNVPSVVDPVVRTDQQPDGTKRVIYKRDDLLIKANQGLNMATTHSLFQGLKRSDYSHFQEYDLILDEVLTPIKVIDMTPDDIKIGFDQRLLVENKTTGEVTYTGDEYDGKFYKKLKRYCDTSNVIYIDGRLLVWAFPPEIFKSFNSIKVLTYLFEGSLLAAYFKYYNIDFDIDSQSKAVQLKKKQEIKKLLGIYSGSKNKVGENYYAFSLSWLKKQNSNDLGRISKSVSNLIQTKYKTKSGENAYTTFKDFKGKLKGKGYTSGFIAVNERATNKYSDRKVMIYMANRFVKPEFKMFFNTRDILIDEDRWALAELIQWLWRGSIRKNQHMNLFIPSKRMRELLVNWIDDLPQVVQNSKAA